MIRTKKGFTLIELLVVIAIIAILAAILYPVFAQARNKAKQATCLSNIKQIMLAQLMYMEDWDGRMTPPTKWIPDETDFDPANGVYQLTWNRQLIPYLKSTGLFRCPILNIPYQDPGWGQFLNNSPAYQIALNNGGGAGSYQYIIDADYFYQWYPLFGPVLPNWPPWFQLTAGTWDPSKVAVFTENIRPNKGVGPYALLNMIVKATSMYIDWSELPHNNGMNWAFLDGHAKWLNFDTTLRVANDPLGNGVIQYFLWVGGTP